MQRQRALLSSCSLLYRCMSSALSSSSTSASALSSELQLIPASLLVRGFSTLLQAGPLCIHTASVGRGLLPRLVQRGLLHQAPRLSPCQAAMPHLSSTAAGAPPARPVTTTAYQQQQHKAAPESKPQYDSLEISQEKINAITDKIPQRPVGVVEGASYSVIILAAFGVLAFVLYHFVFNFILEPTALQCFNHTLDLLKADPRITVRLGATDEIRAWGSNSTSRVARQQVPHQIYKDAHGTEHVRIQFYMRGPGGTGLVNADMYKDESGKWAYTYLLMDVYGNNSNTPSRVYVIRPQ